MPRLLSDVVTLYASAACTTSFLRTGTRYYVAFEVRNGVGLMTPGVVTATGAVTTLGQAQQQAPPLARVRAPPLPTPTPTPPLFWLPLCALGPGLLFFGEAPVPAPARLHEGSTLGVHTAHVNNAHSLPFVLDHCFRERTPGLNLAGGTLTLALKNSTGALVGA